MNSQRVLNFFQNRGVNQFRGMAQYSKGDLSIEYSRDDKSLRVLRAYSDDILFQRAKENVQPGQSQGIQEDLNAVLHYYSGCLLIHLLVQDGTGIIAIFDPSVAPDTYKFIEKSLHLASSK